MALPDLNQPVAHSFGLEFDGIVFTAIQEVSGLKLEQDVVELKQNTPDGKFMIIQLPGRQKVSAVTLTMGLDAKDTFDKWINSSQFGKMPDARKGGAIIVYDYEGQPIKRFVLTNAWPTSLEVGTLKAGDATVLTQKLTITYDSIEVTSA